MHQLRTNVLLKFVTRTDGWTIPLPSDSAGEFQSLQSLLQSLTTEFVLQSVVTEFATEFSTGVVKGCNHIHNKVP